jgi:hypothetical protein
MAGDSNLSKKFNTALSIILPANYTIYYVRKSRRGEKEQQ